MIAVADARARSLQAIAKSLAYAVSTVYKMLKMLHRTVEMCI